MMRLVDLEEFSKYDSMKPTALNFLARCEGAVSVHVVSNRFKYVVSAPNRLFAAAADTEPAHAGAFHGTRPFSYSSYPVGAA